LPEGFEASLGARFMYWKDNPAWIYTGSVSWLHNKNYLAFRPFFCYRNSRYIDSYNLTYRRYFTEKEDYLYAVVGYGNYSDEFVQLNPRPGNSYLVQVGVLKFITARYFLMASAGYAHDDGYRSRFQASAGVRYYFNI
jgi:YaiO family outer membrane protein